MDSLLQDVGHAVRTMRKSPTFAIAAVAMLAIGIGVNALVFSVTNGALFKGFPLVVGNDRILYISNNGKCCVSYPDSTDWRAQTTQFDDMALVHGLGITLTDGAGFPEVRCHSRRRVDRDRGRRPRIGSGAAGIRDRRRAAG